MRPHQDTCVCVRRYSRIYAIDGKRPGVNPNFLLAKRSPMSILSSLYDDGTNFVAGLAAVLHLQDGRLSAGHAKTMARLMDAVYVEQRHDLTNVVDVYINAMVQVRALLLP